MPVQIHGEGIEVLALDSRYVKDFMGIFYNHYTTLWISFKKDVNLSKYYNFKLIKSCLLS